MAEVDEEEADSLPEHEVALRNIRVVLYDTRDEAQPE